MSNVPKCLVAGLASVLAGCTSAPKMSAQGPEKDAITVMDVVLNVRCEFQEAAKYAKFLSEGDGFTVGADIQMQVVNGMEVAIDSSYATPASSIFRPSLAPRFASTADSIRSVGISLDYSKPDKRDCDANADRRARGRLQGKLGFVEWARNLQYTVKKTEIVPNKAGYTLEFVLDRSLAVTPGLANKADMVQEWTVSPKLGGGYKTSHKLVIALTKNAPKKPMEVVIVSGGTKKRRVINNAPSDENQRRNDLELQNMIERGSTRVSPY